MRHKRRIIFFGITKSKSVETLPTSIEQIFSRLSNENCETKILLVPLSQRRIMTPFLYIKYFLKMIKELHNADILIASSPITSFLALIASKIFNKPFIYRCVDLAEPLTRNIRWKHFLFPYIQIWVAKKSSLIMAVSSFVSDYLILRGVNAEKVTILGHGVNFDFFNPQISSIGILKKYRLENKRVILYSGKITKGYRVDVLVRVFRDVHAKFSDARLLLVGSGDYVSTLQEIITKLRLHDKVIFAGVVPHKDVGRYINIADVCVCPAALFGFPLKLSEYWACMKPVVALGIDYKKIIRDGVDGLVAKTPSEMVKLICELLRNKQLSKKLGQNGFQRARHWDSVAEEFLKMIRKRF